MASVGVVLIGRNEGERLVRCLDSVTDGDRPVAYVDSGSTDGSREEARARGATVVELDMSLPFSAARARNAGWEQLAKDHPELAYIQFVDGDCEVVAGFIEAAAETLDADLSIVAVCGYRHERFPDASVYNKICDVEWRGGPTGEVKAFGGDVMIRLAALQRVGGYDPSVIAAEDDELGVRLRNDGSRIVRIDHVSTLHDADMHTIKQWWQRGKRCGHGYAQVNHLHGEPPEHYFQQNLRRTLLWGAVAPAAAVALAPPTLGLSLAVFARYPLTAARVAQETRAKGFSSSHAWAWGVSAAAQPFAEVFGVAKFHLDRLRQRRPEIIEYKGPDA